MSRLYAVWMPSYGVILKTADCIADARRWVREAFPAERAFAQVQPARRCTSADCGCGQQPCRRWVAEMEGAR